MGALAAGPRRHQAGRSPGGAQQRGDPLALRLNAPVASHSRAARRSPQRPWSVQPQALSTRVQRPRQRGKARAPASTAACSRWTRRSRRRRLPPQPNASAAFGGKAICSRSAPASWAGSGATKARRSQQAVGGAGQRRLRRRRKARNTPFTNRASRPDHPVCQFPVVLTAAERETVRLASKLVEAQGSSQRSLEG